MSKLFDIASNVDDLASRLDSSLSALQFWATDFNAAAEDLGQLERTDDNARTFMWASQNRAPGSMATLDLIREDLERRKEELAKLAEDLYSEARGGASA